MKNAYSLLKVSHSFLRKTYAINIFDHIVCVSAASGEPPLLLAASVHCATRQAVKEARKQLCMWKGENGSSGSAFQLPVPATMPVVKELCGLDIIESYLEWKLHDNSNL